MKLTGSSSRRCSQNKFRPERQYVAFPTRFHLPDILCFVGWLANIISVDKMIMSGKGETIITNDGSTMLKSMAVLHPSAKMLVDLSAAQDVEAGDGTTSVVVLCGSLLGAADKLLGKGIHPSVIAEAFQRAAGAAVKVLHDMSHPVSLTDTATLLQAATTSLSSKIVSQHSGLLAPMAVNAVIKTIDIKTADNVDLKNIRILKKVGGTIEDSEMVEGLVMNQQVLKNGGGPVRMEKAKIGLIQFQLSPPKPDVCLLFYETVYISSNTFLDGKLNRCK